MLINKKRQAVNISSTRSSQGFTLIESLVSMLILSIGLFGLAALQVVSLKSSNGSNQRVQATFLAYDMMDRMRANSDSAKAGNYDILITADAPAVETSSNLATRDINDWISNYVSRLLVSGDAEIGCSAAGLCTVTVQWDESRQHGNASTDIIGIAAGLNRFTFTASI